MAPVGTIQKTLFKKSNKGVIMERIRDKVAIVGMGCTRFGERWDMGMGDLLVEAANEEFEDADTKGIKEPLESVKEVKGL